MTKWWVFVVAVAACGGKRANDQELASCEELTHHIEQLYAGAVPDGVRRRLVLMCDFGTAKHRACVLATTSVEELGTCGMADRAAAPSTPPAPTLTCSDGATQHAPVQLSRYRSATWCEKAGVRHGPYTTFGAEDGELMRATYKQGVLDGEYTSKDTSGTYKAGKRHGVWKTKELEMTVVDGVAEGPYKEKAGGVIVHGAWSKGKRSGTWRYEDSRAGWSGAFADGKRDGRWTVTLHGTDRPMAAGTYKAGRRQGDWRFWDTRGQLIDEKVAFENDWLGLMIDVDVEPTESLDLMLGPDPE